MSGLCGSVDFTDGGRATFSHQATVSASGSGGSVCLVADVRLDNREELIRHLTALGLLAGPSLSDADVLLAAYRAWGTSCPERLLGDFAFAVWDAAEQRLFCARDPLGIKPFHYARVGPLFCFASEAQQILQHPAIPCRLDEQTVAAYLMDTWDDPERSFFQGIKRLLPAHSMISTPGGDRSARYWDIDPEKTVVYRQDHEYTGHFLEVFQRAVEDRLRSPAGPVGILMSGGLDSTSVAAMARRAGPHRELFSCSFVFPSLKECDESRYIEATAGFLGFETELVDAESSGFLGAFRPRMETPFLAWEQTFAEVMGRAQARGARVLLTGHGGDELMVGSALVYADRLLRGDLRALAETLPHAAAQGRSAWRILYRYFGHLLIPGKVDRKLRRLLGRADGPTIPAWLQPDFVRRNGLAEAPPYFPRAHPRGRAWQELYDTFFYLRGWEPAAQWYDHASSPFSVEMRHPFLDRRLVELLLAFPSQQRSRPGRQKPFLRRAMRGLLPEEVRRRATKTSLKPYFDFSLRRKEHERIQELMARPLAAEIGILNRSKLKSSYEGWLADENAGDLGLWQFLTLEIWLRTIFDQQEPALLEWQQMAARP